MIGFGNARDGRPPVLSICIPTFNRAERLAETLGALLSQVQREAPPNTVEVVVSDNGSTDSTPIMIEEMLERCPELRYSRLGLNTGYSRNAVNAVRMARGDFVALAGDDDAFVDGAVTRLLEATESGSDVVIVNSAPVGPRVLPESMPILDAPACVEHLGVFHVSFIANAMVRRALFLECVSDDLLDSAYVHAGVVFRALGRVPGSFRNFATVRPDNRLRSWRTQQALYSAVDMARLLTEEVFRQHPPTGLVWRSYWTLVKSVPRVVLGVRRRRISADEANPYASISLGNVLSCYRASRIFQVIAASAWCVAHVLPTWPRLSEGRA